MHRITLLPSGRQFDAADGQFVLAAALAAGIALASSCRNGTCRACRCRLADGRAEHVIEWPGLSREEKAEGWVLPCVLRPLTDCVLDLSAA